jgi:hypothetical protein
MRGLSRLEVLKAAAWSSLPSPSLSRKQLAIWPENILIRAPQ